MYPEGTYTEEAQLELTLISVCSIMKFQSMVKMLYSLKLIEGWEILTLDYIKKSFDPNVWGSRKDLLELLMYSKWDEAHVVNEQFLIFKNNEKLKKFSCFWESLSNKASDGNLWAFAEGVEIGMSASHSKMTYEYYQWQRILNDCFTFNSVCGNFYKRF